MTKPLSGCTFIRWRSGPLLIHSDRLPRSTLLPKSPFISIDTLSFFAKPLTTHRLTMSSEVPVVAVPEAGAPAPVPVPTLAPVPEPEQVPIEVRLFTFVWWLAVTC
ncbi:hypothetical protein [Cyprinid herpesvirus 3]|uniref:Uncharacterized protein n=1 Tax=Cyprinid herpesvirus 3 TaxID=180230 RepID=A4FTA2_CYHV3|nr:hypothetical protein [Cyprinid herpesvirus 3]BAF48976.1 hypothetical protein [Cyprinid herpesvirus 3]